MLPWMHSAVMQLGSWKLVSAKAKIVMLRSQEKVAAPAPVPAPVPAPAPKPPTPPYTQREGIIE